MKGGIGITSTVYEVGSCGENEKNKTLMRCKDKEYDGFFIFARVDDRDEAIDELMEHCQSKRLRNVTRKSGPSTSGLVYAVEKKI